MKIEVLDTSRTLETIFRLPLTARAGAMRELLAPMYANVPIPGDVIDLHHQGGGARVDIDDPRYLDALETLVSRDVHGQIERALAQAWEHLTASVPGIKGPQHLKVLFMLGNPDDEYLINDCGGYYGMGGAPGWLYIIGWPSPEVVDRLAFCAVHEFHHQVRYRNVQWNPVTVTVAEHVVAEGLAEAFVKELFGTEAAGPWGASLSAPELEDAFARIVTDLHVTGMQNTPAYVLGDTAMKRFGSEPKGIPDFAGYPAGLRLVEDFIASAGMTVAQASILPAAHFVSKYQ